MIIRRHFNLFGYLLVLSLALNACGPVTPFVQPVASATAAPQASPAFPPPTASAPVNPALERITPENVDRLEQIARLGTGYIHDLAVSPDHRQIALYVHNEIRVYDAETLTLRQTILAGPYASADGLYQSWSRLAFAPDSQTLVFSSNRSWIEFWDLAKNERTHRFVSPIPEWPVSNLEFSPDGEGMVVTTLGASPRCDGRDMNFALYDLQGRLLFDQYHCADYSSNSYHFTSDGKVIFLLSSIMTDVRPSHAYVVDVRTGQVLEASHAIYDEYKVVPQELLYDISPDGKILAYVTYGEKAPFTRLVDFTTRQTLQTVEGQIEFVLENGKTSWRVPGNSLPQPAKVGFGECQIQNNHMLDDYQLLRSSSESAALLFSHVGRPEGVELWDPITCQVMKTISFPRTEKTVFSPDGRWLASDDGYNAYVWDVRTGQLRLTVPGKPFEEALDIIQFNADGTRFLAGTRGRDNVFPGQPYRHYTIFVYDVETGKPIREIEPQTEFLYGIAGTPEREIILAEDSAGFHFWNIETGELLSNIPSGPYVFNPNASELWVVPEQGNDGMSARTIVQIDYKIGQTVRELATLKTPWVSALYLDTKAQRIMAHLFLGQGKEGGGAVSILDVQTGKELLNYRLPTPNYTLSVSGDLFVTGGLDGYTRLWSYDQDIPYRIWQGGRTSYRVRDSYDEFYQYVSNANASLFDERLLMTGGEELHFWDAESGALLAQLSTDYSRKEITFSPDKSLIAVVGQDGLIRLWGVRKP